MLFILPKITSLLKYFLLSYFLVVVTSCRELQQENNTKNHTIITIQPLSSVSAEQQQLVYNHLKAIYSSVELKEIIPLL